MRSHTIAAAVFATAFIAACSSAEKTPEADSVPMAQTMSEEPSVSITSPADGDTVSLPFTVQLEAHGVEVVAATGTAEPGKGHHHLVIDGDAPSDTLPLPPMPIVIHMGNGATEKVLDSLSEGPHRIIAIFASGDHVPMTSVKRDTITVVVKR